MTAEIAILNKTSIALAADSAVTMSSSLQEDVKIYNSANKLFALSKYHPVGIMIYGNAEFMDIPWEVIIKMYRNKLNDTCFDTLEEYVEDFKKFLTDGFFSEEQQKEYLSEMATQYFQFIKYTILQKLQSLLSEKESVLELEVLELVDEVIQTQYEYWDEKEKLTEMFSNINDFEESFKQKYYTILSQIINDIFDELPLKEELKNILSEIILLIFVSEEIINLSGIVIAGFGDKELFPSLFALEMQCVINNKLKYIHDEEKSASVSVKQEKATIIPFAQDDMVRTFIEGIDPNLLQFTDKYLLDVLQKYSKIILENIDNSLENYQIDINVLQKELESQINEINHQIIDKYREDVLNLLYKNHVSPILSAVEFLPKDELAAMAEALINITSLKRRFSTVSETVGGPVDVAIISKGDGFIWVKRKHYFQPELNHHFFKNYFP